ncbi:hypothetical protein VNO77_39563 [Canavalia gladiata]|uniref:Uncharacterized protein n=1 Tax=Canavalia gladiata TaxID=3824 RepID=A0AAN9JYU5_CANGL
MASPNLDLAYKLKTVPLSPPHVSLALEAESNRKKAVLKLHELKKLFPLIKVLQCNCTRLLRENKVTLKVRRRIYFEMVVKDVAIVALLFGLGMK